MRKFITRICILLGLICLYSVIKLTVDFNRAENVAASSVEKPWPENFKQSFIQGCNEQIKNQPYASRSIASIMLRTNSEKYCECLAHEVEKRKVIATNYNSLKESEMDYINKSSILIDRFLYSDAGRQTIQHCQKNSKSNSTAKTYKKHSEYF